MGEVPGATSRAARPLSPSSCWPLARAWVRIHSTAFGPRRRSGLRENGTRVGSVRIPAVVRCEMSNLKAELASWRSSGRSAIELHTYIDRAGSGVLEKLADEKIIVQVGGTCSPEKNQVSLTNK